MAGEKKSEKSEDKKTRKVKSETTHLNFYQHGLSLHKLDKQAVEVKQTANSLTSFVKSVGQNLVSRGDGGATDSTSGISLSKDAPSNVKEYSTNQLTEKGLYYPPTSCFGYYYPGHDGAYSEWNKQGYVHTGGVEMHYSHPKRYNCMGKISPFSNQGHGGLLPPRVYSNVPLHGKNWAGNNGSKLRERSWHRGNVSVSNDLTRGPRARRMDDPLRSSSEKDQAITAARKDKYNKEDFQTTYEQAMFFVIKSYSEDDIHKSIKYNVWASTPNGNQKLDAAFHEAETKSHEKGTRCPIFLFFSVNSSGQFGGLAEMIGKVDFKKNMDFWQQDKWNGFFPVKWHIIKDIPNSQLRHIILENNDNKPVTNSRDTQEIGFPQGVEMLKIFKSYVGKTSVLDDFEFYEERAQSVHGRSRRHPQPQRENGSYNHLPKQVEVGTRKFKEGSARSEGTPTDPEPSLIDLTKNLLLNPRSPLKNTTKDSTSATA